MRLLKKLVISFNLLTTPLFDPYTDVVLKELESLDLQGNAITFLTARSFGPVPMLKYLWLSGNNLYGIDNQAFSGLHHLRVLSLQSQKSPQTMVSVGAFTQCCEVLTSYLPPWRVACIKDGNLTTINASTQVLQTTGCDVETCDRVAAK
eukprot:g58133.t1